MASSRSQLQYTMYARAVPRLRLHQLRVSSHESCACCTSHALATQASMLFGLHVALSQINEHADVAFHHPQVNP